MRIVGCFLEYDGKFVIVLRHAHKPDGNMWGLPGGKVEDGESDQAAILRELEEETGYRATADELQLIGDYKAISSSGTPYTYVTYKVGLKKPHKMILEKAAHAEYEWVTAQECFAKPNLIKDFDKLLQWVGYMPKIEQTYTIQAPLAKVWQAFTTAESAEQWGAGPAKVEAIEGGEYSYWGGDIHGVFTTIVPQKLIEQDWYGHDNPTWKYRVSFLFEDNGTETMVHMNFAGNIQDDQKDAADWKEYYFDPIKKLLEQ